MEDAADALRLIPNIFDLLYFQILDTRQNFLGYRLEKANT